MPEGSHALVTGGGRGIGLAIAQALTGEGMRLTLVGRDRARLQEAARPLKATPIAADVSDPKAIERAHAEAVAANGPVDVLVNNAGIVETALVHKTSLEMWERLLRVNLTGAFLWSKVVVPGMVERKWGRIVNIGSTTSQRGYAYVAAYAASKHGMLGLTRSLAMEVVKAGVTVNAVCPGYTDTDIVSEAVKAIVAKTGKGEDFAEASLTQYNPQGRLIRPEEVAATVLWLVRPGSESVTGQAISLSGGEIM
ncbi:MAG: SDR family oxidoreductase [Alphaproteobacteria bacterium]|nr:SDR family oxidoreductase [Alphaproteobacteria bacterium]